MIRIQWNLNLKLTTLIVVVKGYVRVRKNVATLTHLRPSVHNAPPTTPIDLHRDIDSPQLMQIFEDVRDSGKPRNSETHRNAII